MREPRIYVDIDLGQEVEVLLPDAAAHHIGRVLRKRKGQRLWLFDGRGQGRLAQIISMDKREVRVSLLQEQEENRESSLSLCLAQCISRGQHMDYTLQKAVELGVSHITPLLSEFSNVKIAEDRVQGKMQHWQQTIINAAEQCGRNRLPTLDAPRSLQQWLSADQAATRLLLHPGAGRGLAAIEPPAAGLCLLAGPEGGFSEEEVERALASGCMQVDLGPRILRTETAPVAALSICQFLWGDLDPAGDNS